jgi:hypothetical protein
MGDMVAILEGGGLHGDVSILVLGFIHNGRINQFVLRVAIYDFDIALGIFDHGACISHRQDLK